MVIDRGAFLAGRYGQVLRRDRRRSRAACGTAHLKVILETGELATLDNVRRASVARAARGRRLHQDLDRQGHPGRDAAGRARDAAGRARLRGRDRRAARRQAGRRHPREQGGDPLPRDGQRGRRRRAGSTPTCFRFGASSLLNDLLLQRHKLAHRQLRRPRLRDARLSMADRAPPFEYAPAPGGARDRARCASSYGIFVDGEFRAGAGETVATIDPSTGDAAGRGRRGRRRPTSTPPCAAARARLRIGLARPARARARASTSSASRARSRSAPASSPCSSRSTTASRSASRATSTSRWRPRTSSTTPAGPTSWSTRASGPTPQPLGVAGQVIPWNFPLLMAAWKIAPGAGRRATRSCSSPPRRRR